MFMKATFVHSLVSCSLTSLRAAENFNASASVCGLSALRAPARLRWLATLVVALIAAPATAQTIIQQDLTGGATKAQALENAQFPTPQTPGAANVLKTNFDNADYLLNEIRRAQIGGLPADIAKTFTDYPPVLQRYFERAIAAQPTEARHYLQRGKFRQTWLGDLPAAQADYEKVVALAPNFGEGHVLLAAMRQAQGDAKAARDGAAAAFERFQQQIKNRPNAVGDLRAANGQDVELDFLNELAFLGERWSNVIDGRNIFSAGAERLDRIRARRILSYLAVGDEAKAGELLATAPAYRLICTFEERCEYRARNTQLSPTQRLRVVGLLGENTAAKKQLDQLIASQPNLAAAYLERAELGQALRRSYLAYQQHVQAAAARPDAPKLWPYQQAERDRRLAQQPPTLAAIVADYERAAQLGQKSARLYLGLASAQGALGQAEKAGQALDAFDEAVARGDTGLRPKAGNLADLPGLQTTERDTFRGRDRDLERQWRQTLSEQPLALATALKDNRRALRYLEQSIADLLPKTSDGTPGTRLTAQEQASLAKLLDQRIDMLARLDRPQELEAAYRQYLQYVPDSATRLADLHSLLEKAGRHEEVIADLKARDMAPELSAYLKRLGRHEEAAAVFGGNAWKGFAGTTWELRIENSSAKLQVAFAEDHTATMHEAGKDISRGKQTWESGDNIEIQFALFDGEASYQGKLTSTNQLVGTARRTNGTTWKWWATRIVSSEEQLASDRTAILAAMTAKDWAKARGLIEHGLELDPRSLFLLDRHGMCLLGQDKPFESLVAFDRAVAVAEEKLLNSPSSPAATQDLAFSLMRRCNWTTHYPQFAPLAESKADSERLLAVVEKLPSDFSPVAGQLRGVAHLFHADVLHREKRLEESQQALEEAARLGLSAETLERARQHLASHKPVEEATAGHARYLGTAKVRFDQQDFAAAERDLVKALTYQPEDASAVMLLGQCQLSLKQYAQAEASFKQALELDPKQATAERYLSLAEAQLAADGFVGAEASALAALRLDGSSAKAQAIQGLAKLGQMRDTVGLGHLDINDPISKAVRVDPQLTSWVLKEMSRIKPGYRIAGLGQEADAGRIQAQIARANAIGMEAMALSQKGDYKNAADTMLRCADAYPASQPGIICTIRMQAIQLRFQAGDNQAALADADRTIQLFPDLPTGYAGRYLALKLLNRNDDAEAAKQKLVEMKAPEAAQLDAALLAIQAMQRTAKP